MISARLKDDLNLMNTTFKKAVARSDVYGPSFHTPPSKPANGSELVASGAEVHDSLEGETHGTTCREVEQPRNLRTWGCECQAYTSCPALSRPSRADRRVPSSSHPLKNQPPPHLTKVFLWGPMPLGEPSHSPASCGMRMLSELALRFPIVVSVSLLRHTRLVRQGRLATGFVGPFFPVARKGPPQRGSSRPLPLR